MESMNLANIRLLETQFVRAIFVFCIKNMSGTEGAAVSAVASQQGGSGFDSDPGRSAWSLQGRGGTSYMQRSYVTELKKLK